jgi:hypothetical protein
LLFLLLLYQKQRRRSMMGGVSSTMLVEGLRWTLVSVESICLLEENSQVRRALALNDGPTMASLN